MISSQQIDLLSTIKLLLETHALLEAHLEVLMPKMLIFNQIPPTIEPLIDAHPQILHKVDPTLCRKVSNFLLATIF